MAISVPDTSSFKLSDVIAAVEDHAGNIDDTLSDAFINSIDNYFNSIYKGNKDRLSNFRDYGPIEEDPNCPIFVPTGFSPNGDGVNDYLVVGGLECYPIHQGSVFSNSYFTAGGKSFVPGDLIYRRTNDYDDYPWDGNYNGAQCPETYYTFILEIDHKQHTSETVLLLR